MTIEILRELNTTSILVRVAMAMIVGGIIGLERLRKNQPVGSRTYMLVCLGACLVMMTNQYICNMYNSGDPSRLGAQVISGIGFLGAGTIIVTGNNKIRGLTTAAGLWSAACIGLAIGIGFYEGAIAAGAVLLFIMTVFKNVENRILKDSRALHLYVNLESSAALNHMISVFHDLKIQVDDLQVSKPKKGGTKEGIIVLCLLKLAQKQKHSELIRQFSELDGVLYIEELK